jgi:primosomal replication protein N
MYDKQKIKQEEKSTMLDDNIITRREKKSPSGEFFNKFDKVFISGRIEAEFEYSHTVMWENFYRTRVRVERPIGTEDLVPIVISENILKAQGKMETSLKGKWVEVSGQFRSYNRLGEDGRKHLELFLFVTLINICDNEDELEEPKNSNLIYLDGYLCKLPICRMTPSGKYIADFCIAVNRTYGRSDYIPCIAWGRIAQLISKLEVGSHIRLYGKIQSRKYFKKYSPDSEEGEYRDAYEILALIMKKMEKTI